MSQDLWIVSGNSKVSFNSLASIQKPEECSSGYIAYENGKEVGSIWKSADIPEIDARFLGATTMLTGEVLDYTTFLALIGSDIDVPEDNTRQNSAYFEEEQEVWDVTHARFAAHGGAVEGCHAGARNSRYYEINIFSTFNVAVGSLAFETWSKLSMAGPGFRTQHKAFRRLVLEKSAKKSICFSFLG